MTKTSTDPECRSELEIQRVKKCSDPVTNQHMAHAATEMFRGRPNYTFILQITHGSMPPQGFLELRKYRLFRERRNCDFPQTYCNRKTTIGYIQLRDEPKEKHRPAMRHSRACKLDSGENMARSMTRIVA